jgi:hypothetical protein
MPPDEKGARWRPGCLAAPLEGEKPMQRIDGSFLYTVGANVHPLSELSANTKLHIAMWICWMAQQHLEQLLGSVFRLRTSRESCQVLLDLVTALSKRATESKDQEEAVSYQVHAIQKQLRDFEAVLAAEFRVSTVYLITQRKGLDPGVMIEMGWEAFPSALPNKVPTAMPDARDAMRAMMFELPTAAGFHLHRANESVLHKYFDAVSSGAPRPKNRNMGDYLAEMDKLGVGEKPVKAALRDLKDLHRNPLIHPDHSLETFDEAYGLYCGVFTAMEAMLKAIPPPLALPPPPPAAT